MAQEVLDGLRVGPKPFEAGLESLTKSMMGTLLPDVLTDRGPQKRDRRAGMV